MKLSIIIPVYNVEQYLQRCFDSVKGEANNATDCEIIFVNDGSTDNSLEIIKEYKLHYSFVTVIDQVNQGLSAARNVGIKESKGEYFILLDSDDWLELGEIIKVYDLAVKNDVDLAGFHLQFVNEHFEVTGISIKHPLPYNKIISGQDALIKGYQPSSACLFLYKSSFIKENKLEFYRGIMQEDVEFTLRLLIYAEKAIFTDIIGYSYYRRSDSMTTTMSGKKVEQYLSDSIIVASLIKGNLKSQKKIFSKPLQEAIKKNYNSVVWNLLWRFRSKPGEVSKAFRNECIDELKKKSLYPIKGPLKTPFQNVTRVLFNFETLFRILLKGD
ncbi:MAG: glycosyltransferase [Taibaiella sp.]